MPPSVFRGRPWPAPGEPLWLDGDRDEAVAMLTVDWDTCSGCGQSLTQSTDPDAEGRYTVDQVQCAGCQVREAVVENVQGPGRIRGLMLRVRRK